MILRPYGLLIHGSLEFGLELVMDGDQIAEVRSHTGIPESFVVSPAFVNAHSHLEYRGMLGQLKAPDYWGFIREITELKTHQTMEQVASDCELAAQENVATGVAMICEHSDRPYSGAAMANTSLYGQIFQEVITFNEQLDPGAKLAQVRTRAAENEKYFPGVRLTPHAPHTVDPATLRDLGTTGDPISIHACETTAEREMFEHGAGPIADFYAKFGFEPPKHARGPLGYLDELRCLHPRTQIVHACDLTDADLALLAARGASVAHCPRSNVRLQCPTAPVRRMLEAGIRVGLGMDSCASGGPIDMFAEMRAALQSSRDFGQPISAEQVWSMATEGGYASLPSRPQADSWAISPGSRVPLIAIHLDSVEQTEDLVSRGSPKYVEWIRTARFLKKT